MRIVSSLWPLSLAFVLLSAGARGDSSGSPLRIGLVGRFGSPSALAVVVPPGARLLAGGIGRPAPESAGMLRVAATADGEVALEDTKGGVLVSGESVSIEPPAGGEPVGAAASMTMSAGITRGKLSARGRPVQPTVRRQDRLTRYRGSLEIRARPGRRLQVVNVVSVEEYVRGVVALEIGADAPMEALKAQAVAARTYALKSRGRFAKQGYDLTDTTASQAYGGVEAEAAATDRAVRETRGLALVKDGRLVLADYYDDCGGVTAPGEDDSDYPPSVVDAPEGGPDYCAAGRSHVWRLVLTADEIDRIARGISRWPAGTKVAKVDVASMDESGRARAVRFTAADGASKEIRGAALRALVGYSRLKSTLFTVSKTDAGFVFEGRGYGHGRGMCQAGAVGMASPPYSRSFREILAHYFPGASVEAWSDPAPIDETGRAPAWKRGPSCLWAR